MHINNTDNFGLKQGIWVSWRQGFGELYPEVRLTCISSYLNDTLNGERICKYQNGLIAEVANFSNGKISGVLDSYYPNGNLQSSFYHMNGVPNGSWYYYFDSGRIQLKETYINGYIEGERSCYYKNGQLFERSYYYKGMVTGKFQQFDSIGKLLVDGNYVNAEKSGIWKYFYPNGELEAVYQFNLFGLKQGIAYKFYDSGQIAFVENYSNDMLHGEKLWFDENGALFGIQMFEAGVLVKTISIDK